ncbi:sensor histidine kinase [Microbacterium sp. H83]|uniref:sensor histidine kinase n=1 Tax=Microbacterium sp. H83 TaxID=1827324 RepID=UPI0007F354EE|nr:sensor histidine kinase [Microbacterium sp. H83]OAN38302.1 hypothetical protein A4X16_02605 [Microbacterium sp. H83]
MARSPGTQRTRRTARASGRSAAVAALGAAVITLYAVLVPIQATLYGTSLPLSFLLAAALCGAPLLALTHPRWAVVLFYTAAFSLPLLVTAGLATEAPWPWSVPALLAFVLLVGVVTFLHGARLGAFALVIGSGLSLTAPLLRGDVLSGGDVAANVTANLIVTTSVAAAVSVIAALAAGRMRVSAELTREREHSALEESRRGLVEERTRIARELHDVIAHSMSVIQVQASTARYRLPGIDAEAAAEFDSIAATARTSLTEMRRMLGVLRTEDRAAELAPLQGVDDVPALVDTFRRAGVTVGLEITGSLEDPSSAAQIAVFRIVQEALSNAIRHAAGAAVTVRIQRDGDMLVVRVRNASASTPQAASGGGYGLRGMRERVEILGGTFAAGPAADGGWEVAAALPLRSIDMSDGVAEEAP